MRRFFLFLILFLVLSCSRRDIALFNPSTYYPAERGGTAVQPLKNDQPENVLENVKISYDTRNYNLYQSLLLPDYRFYMCISYTGAFNNSGSTPDPAYWTMEFVPESLTQKIYYYKTYAQELESTRRMFDPAGGAQDIRLDFQASEWERLSADTVIYNIRNLELAVTLRNSPVPIVAADADLSSPNYAPTRVWLVRGADMLWKIWRWQDGTAGPGDELQ
jgi:hypothetical protein